MRSKLYPKKIIIQLWLALLVSVSGLAQMEKQDSSLFVKFVASVTQNGISFIPTFSLGKPAIILEPHIGNKRFSFEPQFRFSIDGKPWSFIFIYRYKVIKTRKFYLQVGGHLPSIVFKNHTANLDGIPKDWTTTNRYLVAELIPHYTVSENVGISMFFLRGFGFDPGSFKDAYYTGIRSTITNINLTKRIYFKITPQVYYLKTDDKDGFYVTNTLTLALRKFPLSISNIINKAIQTDIHGNNFDWNLSLVYTLDRHFKVR